MDLSLLETFRTIAEEGSFSRAGQKLLRTQPAVSLALKRLEAELGVTLIDRTTKSLSLTDAGQAAALGYLRHVAAGPNDTPW